MNLIWFLTIAIILSSVMGEFGKFPFGSPTSVSVTDILLGLTLSLFFIWKIAIEKNIFWPKEFRILALFWLIGIIGLFFSRDFQGGLYLVRFIFYSSSFLISYFLLSEKKIQIFDLLRVFGIAGLVFLLLGFLQLIFLPNFDQLSLLGFDPHRNRLTSTFLDPNFAATYLVLAIGISWNLYLNSKRREWLFVIFFELLGLGLTFSRSGYLMLFISVAIFGVIKEKKVLYFLLLLVIISQVVPSISQRIMGGLTVDASAQDRLISWKNGLYIFGKSPFLGVGFDNLRQVFGKYNLFPTFTSNGGNSGAGVDSSFIFVLATTGILGFLIYIFWWVKILKKAFFGEKPPLIVGIILGCLFLGLFIDSQFINSLFYPPVMLMIYLTTGSLAALKKS